MSTHCASTLAKSAMFAVLERPNALRSRGGKCCKLLIVRGRQHRPCPSVTIPAGKTDVLTRTSPPGLAASAALVMTSFFSQHFESSLIQKMLPESSFPKRPARPAKFQKSTGLKAVCPLSLLRMKMFLPGRIRASEGYDFEQALYPLYYTDNLQRVLLNGL